MAAIIHTKEYGPFVRGLNSRFLTPSLQDTECSVLQNAQVNNDGSIEKYPGFIIQGNPFPLASTSFIRTLFDFRRGSALDLLLIAASDAGNANSTYKVDIKSTIGDGTYQYIGHNIGTAAFVATNTSVTGTNTSWTHELKPGDKIKSIADSDSAYTEIATVNSDTSLTLVAGGYLGTTQSGAYLARKIWSNTNIPRMVAFNNVCVIVDGNGIPQQYDGTSLNDLINTYSGTVITVQPNAAPIGKYVIKHKSRVFMADTQNLYWSHVNDQTFWDPASFTPIFPNDGGDIINIISFSDSIYVFKNNGKIYRVFGNFDDSAIGTPAYITTVSYSENIGIISERGIFIHGGGGVGNQFAGSLGAMLYFIAETGIYTVNYYGQIERISYYIQPTTDNINFSLGAQTAKSYPFNTLTLWNTGTNNGTNVTPSGVLYSFFDEHRETDARAGYNFLSVCIGTDNSVHVVYVNNATPTKLTYLRYKADGTVRKEDVGVTITTQQAISIAVSAVDQTVGIAYLDLSVNNVFFVERTPDSGMTFGTWGSPVNTTNGNIYQPLAIATQYTLGGVPGIAINGINSPAGHFSDQFYTQRNSGVWNSPSQIASTGGTPTSANWYRIGFIFDSINNIYVVATSSFFGSNTRLQASKSTNGGVTWSSIELFNTNPQLDTESCLACALDNNSHFISVWSDGTNTQRRDHTAGSTTTLDNPSTHPLCRGWFTFYDTPLTTQEDYLYNVDTVTTQERFTFETSNELNNSSNNQINTSAGHRPSDNPFKHNGQVTAMVGFGNNSNEIIIRRISFFGNWTSPEDHDSTLTAWGIYAVTGQVANGNTIQHQVALASSSPANSFNNITPGSIISSNANLIFIKAKVNFTLTQWAGISISSIILNYTGAGVDSRQAFGISFYDEAYFAVGSKAGTTNDGMIIQDFKGAFLTTTYSVNCMERFKTLLYAGDAEQGNLLILKQGTNFNDDSPNMDVQTKEDFLGSIELKKDFYKVYILYQVQTGGSFIFSYRFDNFATPGGVSWIDTTINLTGAGNENPGFFEIPLNGQKARSIQFRIQNLNNTDIVQVYGFTLHYGLMNRR